MADLQIRFFSQAISRFTTVQMCLPTDVPPMLRDGNPHYRRPMKTLFLLHGFSGNSQDWLYGSRISDLAGLYNLAVVMPQGDNSFYLNGRGSDRGYEDFLCGDLVQFVRNSFRLALRSEDTLIGGLSMGGFGAIHSALRHPEIFGKVFGLSSALICEDIRGLKPGEQTNIADYDYYTGVFGDLATLDTSDKNPWFLLKQYRAQGRTIPPLYMAIGTEDFLLETNRSFRDAVRREGFTLSYHESPGIHDWKFWNEYLEPALRWALEEEEKA